MDPYHFINRIRLLYDLKKYDLGITLFKEQAHLLMDYPTGLYHAGRCYIRLDRGEEALVLFHRGLEIDPLLCSIKLEIAKYYTDENPEKAEALVRECLAQHPQELAYWGTLGSICYTQEKYAKAAEAFAKCLTLDPNDFRSIVNIAACKDELGQWEEALSLYRMAISIRPNYIYAYLNIGANYSDRGLLHEAEEAYFQALRIDPTMPSSFYGLACVYALKNQRDKSLDFLAQSIAKAAKYKAKAIEDKDFENLKEDPRFIELTSK